MIRGMKKKKKEKKGNESGREWESIPCLEIPHEGGREGKEETEAIVWQISVERDLALFHRRSNEEGSRLEEGRLDLVISWRFGFLLEADEEQPPFRAFDSRASWTWVLSIFQLVIPIGNEAEFSVDGDGRT